VNKSPSLTSQRALQAASSGTSWSWPTTDRKPAFRARILPGYSQALTAFLTTIGPRDMLIFAVDGQFVDRRNADPVDTKSRSWKKR
jgi:hypothetical protein